MYMNLAVRIALCNLLFIISVHQILGQTTTPLKPLSVHVLDTSYGGNAPNVTCKLYKKVNHNKEKFNLIATAVTDSGGRISEFLSSEDYKFGTYRILFEIGNYYHYSHGVSTFFPQAQITYKNIDGSASHMPLVISPFGISNYKGS